MRKSPSGKALLKELFSSERPYSKYLELLRETESEARVFLLEEIIGLFEDGSVANSLNTLADSLDAEIEDRHWVGTEDIPHPLRQSAAQYNADLELYQQVEKGLERVKKNAQDRLKGGGISNLRFIWLKGPYNLKKLRDELLDHNLVLKGTTLKSFQTVFSSVSRGKPPELLPIKWSGTNYQLKLLILGLVDKKAIPKQTGLRWATVNNCFRRIDGSPFKRLQIQDAKPRKSNRQNEESPILESISTVFPSATSAKLP